MRLSGTSRPIATLAVGLGVGATATAAAGIERPAAGWERATARSIYDLPPPTTGVLEAVMTAGTRGAIVVLAVVLVALGRRSSALRTAAAGALAWVVSEAVKPLVGRPRPTLGTLGRVVRTEVDGFALPSTHAAVAAALATVVVAELPDDAAAVWIALGCAFATAVARVHLGVHWPLDVVAGAGLGVACGAGPALVRLPRRSS
jgi:glycosyltransferase 2 family protein